MSLLYQHLKCRNDPILCPKCRQEARKESEPYRAGSGPIKNGEWGSPGSAFCENPDCDVHKEQELISWTAD